MVDKSISTYQEKLFLKLKKKVPDRTGDQTPELPNLKPLSR
jgi:hypothetical protein